MDAAVSSDDTGGDRNSAAAYGGALGLLCKRV